MNKFRKFLGRISAEIYLKMNYFDSISPKSPSAGGSASNPLASMAGGFAPRPPFRLKDYRMCKTLLPLKVLFDADAWQFWRETKLIFSAPVFKRRSRANASNPYDLYVLDS